LFGRVAWLAMETQIYQVLFPDWIQAQEEGTITIIMEYLINIYC